MGIIIKEVEVKPTGKMIQYYRDKGYDAKYNQLLIVNIDDLPEKSSIHIKVSCDYCGEECNPRYVDYCNSIEIDGTYACVHCAIHKAEKTTYKKYGVLNYSSTKECREKVSNTLMSRYGISHVSKSEKFLKRKCENNKLKYGVEHTLQVKEFRDKGIQTNLEKYGVENVLQCEEIKKRMMSTMQIKYGTPYASQNLEIKNKISNTNLDRYGYECVLSSPEIREKMTKTLYENSSQKSSRQQRYICNLYNGILNFPIKYYSADIYLLYDNIIVEFDGSGHFLNVITGRETEKEHTQKEIIRYNVIKREGYKQMRIISDKDFLPSDQVLLQMLSESRQYFSDYPNHSWTEFNISTSTLRNAENKQGIPYDFGELRKIK